MNIKFIEILKEAVGEVRLTADDIDKKIKGLKDKVKKDPKNADEYEEEIAHWEEVKKSGKIKKG
jgi:hypothetical protein